MSLGSDFVPFFKNVTCTFKEAFDSKDNSPCDLSDVPCPSEFDNEVFESQIGMKTSFNSNSSD